MRIAAYFAGWLLALPGLVLAAGVLMIGRAIRIGNLARILWEALEAFAYGLPLIVLAAFVIAILGFFRVGRLVGGGLLLLASLASIAIILDAFGSPTDLGEALYLAPAAIAAVVGGALVNAESRAPPREAAAASAASRSGLGSADSSRTRS